MVLGIGPRATLEDLDIPLVFESEGVGQNMWVCERQLHLLTPTMDRTGLQDKLRNANANSLLNVTGQAVSEYLVNQFGLLAGIGGGESVGQKPPHPHPCPPPPSNATP